MFDVLPQRYCMTAILTASRQIVLLLHIGTAVSQRRLCNKSSPRTLMPGIFSEIERTEHAQAVAYARHGSLVNRPSVHLVAVQGESHRAALGKNGRSSGRPNPPATPATRTASAPLRSLRKSSEKVVASRERLCYSSPPAAERRQKVRQNKCFLRHVQLLI